MARRCVVSQNLEPPKGIIPKVQCISALCWSEYCILQPRKHRRHRAISPIVPSNSLVHVMVPSCPVMHCLSTQCSPSLYALLLMTTPTNRHRNFGAHHVLIPCLHARCLRLSQDLTCPTSSALPYGTHCRHGCVGTDSLHHCSRIEPLCGCPNHLQRGNVSAPGICRLEKVLRIFNGWGWLGKVLARLHVRLTGGLGWDWCLEKGVGKEVVKVFGNFNGCGWSGKVLARLHVRLTGGPGCHRCSEIAQA